MGRLLFFVLLALLIWIAWTIQRRQKAYHRRTEARLRRMEERQGIHPEQELEMSTLECEQCGIYFPKSEAVHRNGHVYCSEVCAERAERS